ncbi:MAG: hypothetical protein ACREMY_09970 [bacterium]
MTDDRNENQDQGVLHHPLTALRLAGARANATHDFHPPYGPERAGIDTDI